MYCAVWIRATVSVATCGLLRYPLPSTSFPFFTQEPPWLLVLRIGTRPSSSFSSISSFPTLLLKGLLQNIAQGPTELLAHDACNNPHPKYGQVTLASGTQLLAHKLPYLLCLVYSQLMIYLSLYTFLPWFGVSVLESGRLTLTSSAQFPLDR